MTDDENWIPLDEFPGYSINPLGQIRKDSNGRLLATRLNQYGVPYVGIMRGWEQCIRSLPLLVARTFLPRPSNIFNTPIQLDGDPLNCRVENLMWRPRWYAVRYKQQFQEPYDNPIKSRVKCVSNGERFRNSFAAACRYGLLEEEVVMSVHNRTPTWPTYQYFELAKMR